jgi:hypothetical protein
MSKVSEVPDETATELKKLIQQLHTKRFTRIRDVNNVITALENLDAMVGLSDLKTKIAKQTSYLIAKCEEQIFEDAMLNVVLYGPPGTGKTQVGKIIAQIYSGIGFLEQPERAPAINLFEKEMAMPDINKNATAIFYLLMILYFVLLIGILLKQHGGKITAWIYGIFVVGLVIWGYLSMQKPKKIENAEEIDPENSDFRVIAAEDLTAGYLGQSELKTKTLLENSVGKTLFLDEAYSLDDGPYDMYGAKVLTIINRWMSEHPRKTSFIFAGYKDKMKRGIFKSQPGLLSRFMWHFDIPRYSAGELFQIFRNKLKLDDYTMEDEGEVLKLFETYYDLFPSSGRDVAKLCNFVKVEFTIKFLGEPRTVIPTYIIEISMKELENSRPDESDDGGIQDILNRYRPR